MEYIIDIDGTVLNESVEINNSVAFLNQLDLNGDKYLLATNSIKSHSEQLKRLKKIGLNIKPELIYTPIDSINTYISNKKIKRAAIVGSDSEIMQIKANNTLENPEIIILLDFEKSNFAYDYIQKIIDLSEAGSEVISASGSKFYLKDGKKQLDTGAFVALIESVTSKKVEVFGKPSSQYFINAKSMLSPKNNLVTVIGDDWNTDILGGKSVGFETILIRSGKYKCGDEYLAKPTLVIKNFLELI